MINYAAGINNHEKSIRKIDKGNATEICPACGNNKDWGHAGSCTKNKGNREEWEKGTELKIKELKNYSIN